jgi:hypothetical protein
VPGYSDDGLTIWNDFYSYSLMTLYLSFFSTSHCHLCESAENILLTVAEQTDIEYQVVEIADSDTLLELYGVRIPVIKRLDTQAEIGWPFTAEDLAQFLQ